MRNDLVVQTDIDIASGLPSSGNAYVYESVNARETEKVGGKATAVQCNSFHSGRASEYSMLVAYMGSK